MSTPRPDADPELPDVLRDRRDGFLAAGRGAAVRRLRDDPAPRALHDGSGPAFAAGMPDLLPRLTVGRLPRFEPLREAGDATLSGLSLSLRSGSLPRAELLDAAFDAARVLRPSGRLAIVWATRHTDAAGVVPGDLALLLDAAGLRTVDRDSAPGAGRVWHLLLAVRQGPGSGGLERVQAIVAHDRKTATYKLALVRALCAVGRTERPRVAWGDGEVRVPLRSLAAHWLEWYWPLLTGPRFVAQLHGERPDSTKPVAFRRALEALADDYGADGLPALLRDLGERPGAFDEPLAVVAQTIRKGPVRYAGTAAAPVFRWEPSATGERPGTGAFGWVVVPEEVWIDLARFEGWVEDAVMLRWAALTAEMNPGLPLADALMLVLARDADARVGHDVRAGLARSRLPLACVWTGRAVDERSLVVHHLLPWSAWGRNDLWNLLPADRRTVARKSDALPSRRLLLERRDAIVGWWRAYAALWPDRFAEQVARGLGAESGRDDWTGTAFAGLVETVERLAAGRGMRRWEP